MWWCDEGLEVALGDGITVTGEPITGYLPDPANGDPRQTVDETAAAARALRA